MTTSLARSVAMMGTVVTIEARATDDAPIGRALQWFREVEATCSRFDPVSEVSALALRPGDAVSVSELLFEVMTCALAVSDLSDGAFDPAVGFTLEQRGFNRNYATGATINTPIDGAENSATWRDIELDRTAHTITLHRPLLLDLGGIAKGFAIDLATRSLREDGIADFAIDAGGDLYLAGRNAQDESWSVGIRHPLVAGALLDRIRVSDTAVCTSGNYERTNTTGTDTHHIIDPRTHGSFSDVLSVTVVGPNAATADALGTAAFVLGPRDGLALLERAGVDGMIVTADLTTHCSDGMLALVDRDSARPS